MITVETILRKGASLLAEGQIEQPRLEAEWLLAGGARCSRLEFYRTPDAPLSAGVAERYNEALRRRLSGEPLQYLLGSAEFYGLDFRVRPGVLIPRPETELMAETAIRLLRGAGHPARFADIGTGSGCVAITIARHVESAIGLAVDCSSMAIAVARDNVARHGLTERVRVVEGELCEPLHGLERACGVIAANLPYIPTAALAMLPPDVRDHEPRNALDGGRDGLGLIRQLFATAPPYLGPGGRLLVEVGAGQSRPAAELAKRWGWRTVAMLRDLAGIERLLVLGLESDGQERNRQELDQWIS